ncbi:probable carbon monoxide dehydrogenase large chain [Pseudooceanicola batsensis HTCC2597]|uniref:Probable carbon monoxide dehydrogenase large chain n=1 Tax=Pseudooceanicola batsensis (strain ATCC BAA-863 / DSM 15984 / KCTC 12145 / HTCC2597) TaxID=252305 RepID=A3U0U0_PSEBH|nr:xanthine dehydrogenase family protein molybdopterin-binding subunit [Pseudooceanicola batsensis]EAQ02381.1 probable carbon monoxide dehydrogenase large chain [Pseudooceanicola batsensis HTCC2597]
MTELANSGIGAPLPREGARRLAEGRGRYVDDITLPGLLHIAFVRAPFAHGRLLGIETDDALEVPGVVAVIDGRRLAEICAPFDTNPPGVPGHASAPQPPLVVDESCFQGEAVAAVVAESRAAAEDGAELVFLDWDELPAVCSIEDAQAEDAAPVHTRFSDNLSLRHRFGAEDVSEAFHGAAHVVEADFSFGRQTGVTLEPRGIVAHWDPRTEELEVWQSHQVPWQMREVYARQLGLSPQSVRVTAPDVGGAFGLKLHAYADELAAVAVSRLLGRPVKYIVDRLESFTADAHAREARASCRMAVDAEGHILGIDAVVDAGFGAYAMHPRGSFGEAMQAAQMIGAPYRVGAFRAEVRGWRQNKAPSGAYRGVGQPIACAITEEMIDLASRAADIDPAEMRRINYRRTLDEGTRATQAGLVVEELSLDACLDKLLEAMDYTALRSEQAALRAKGIYRGIGLASFVELTGVGAGLYGPLGLTVAANEACRLTLQPDGSLTCATSVTDQGQGTLSAIAQLIAGEFGIAPEGVRMVAGDTGRTPYGGGAWASRGMALGGEAAKRACARLRDGLLELAAGILQCEPEALRFEQGEIIGPKGASGLDLAELAALCHYRPYDSPTGQVPPMTVEESFVPAALPYIASNGVHAVHLEVDPELGTVDLLGYWVVDDCGTVVNPLLVDEQLRGGIVQGIGAALYEECLYSEDGQFTNGTLADYVVPMAGEMPDIFVEHVSTPTRATGLGARGVGEAGTVGGLGAVRTALGDALVPTGARVSQQPFTPGRVLAAIMAAEDAE